MIKCGVLLNESLFLLFSFHPPFHLIPFVPLQAREKVVFRTRLLAPVPFLHSRWCLAEGEMYFFGWSRHLQLLTAFWRLQKTEANTLEGHETLADSATVESRHATFRTYPQRSPERNGAGWIVRKPKDLLNCIQTDRSAIRGTWYHF